MMNLKNSLLYSYNLSRSSGFLVQNLALPIAERILTGHQTFAKQDLDKLKNILFHLNQLLKQDSQEMQGLLSPLKLAQLDSQPFDLLKFVDILVDGYQVSKRRQNNINQDLNPVTESQQSKTPEYYHRNFHFQTDGYFSKQSANRYDHQVEILFAGGAGPMRRLLLKPLNDHHPKIQRILEIGCGTGSLTKYLSALFPEAHITALDLSAPYLWKARQQLSDHVNIDFIQGDGAKLPFKGASFDAVVSCFLFHELPKNERVNVLKESLRVLKPSGFMGLIDSIQKDDLKDLNWALEDFPIRFHEPFYKNYTLTPLELLSQEAGYHDIQTRVGYFAKALWAKK